GRSGPVEFQLLSHVECGCKQFSFVVSTALLLLLRVVVRFDVTLAELQIELFVVCRSVAVDIDLDFDFAFLALAASIRRAIAKTVLSSKHQLDAAHDLAYLTFEGHREISPACVPRKSTKRVLSLLELQPDLGRPVVPVLLVKQVAYAHTKDRHTGARNDLQRLVVGDSAESIDPERDQYDRRVPFDFLETGVLARSVLFVKQLNGLASLEDKRKRIVNVSLAEVQRVSGRCNNCLEQPVAVAGKVLNDF